PDSIHFSYRRFVVNQLRRRFGFEGVPVRMFYKEKRRGRRPDEGPPPRDGDDDGEPNDGHDDDDDAV
ncbi:MAG: hypothetical protein U0169_06175, partial [Polyangiaceae bacterium]